MRAPRTVLVALVTTLLGALAVAFAPASSAGGPTSVLLVDTANGKATALYTSDLRYQRLSDLLGALETPTAAGSMPDYGSWNPGSGGITVTWLMHDVVVWRVDHVLPAAEGGMAIGSVMDMAGISGWDAKPIWHRPGDPKALASLLAGLGLGPQAAPTPAPTVTTAPAAAPVVAARTPAASSSAGSLPGIVWGLAGLAAGAGIALAVPRLRRRRADVEDDEAIEPPASAEVLRS